MTLMNETYKKKIIHHIVHLGTNEFGMIFNDKSQFLFHLDENPKFQISGSENSVAAEFKYHVIGFSISGTACKFTFWDKSELTINTSFFFKTFSNILKSIF